MQQYTRDQINKYVDSKALAWSLTTQRSERLRLHGALDLINQGANLMYQLGIQRYKPYTLKTLFIRTAEFVNFVGVFTADKNEFRLFLHTNRLQFKHAYDRGARAVGMSFEQASARIAGIEDEAVRRTATLMLTSGLRAHEALAYTGDGYVIGKGAKKRPVYSESQPRSSAAPILTYSQLYARLKRVGIRPHDLRKLAASQLVAAGFKARDLMEVMGWSSIETAAIYLQPDDVDSLKQRVSMALNTQNRG